MNTKAWSTMKAFFFIGVLLIMNSCIPKKRTEFSVFHYNIFELNSKKLKSDNSEQLTAVKDIIKDYKIDILSINELQYDMKKGQNLNTLLKRVNLTHLKNTSFEPANTGLNATDTKIDEINYGKVPGEYSMGMATSFQSIRKININNLQWREFNPKADFSGYRTASGKPLPKDLKLFDKNFSDTVVKIDGKKVHIILLHTAPAFHFGNEETINYPRNAEQLRFLHWYLTGKVDEDIPARLEIKGIKHLSPEDYFIAMGDFNTDINDKNKEGSQVLNAIFNDTQTRTWIDRREMTFTNEAPSFSDKPLRLMLDYIITSNNIKSIHGEIIHPKFFEKDATGQDIPTKEYKKFKKASDHYPLFGKFEIE